MVILKSNSKHNPVGHLYEVSEEKAAELVKSSAWYVSDGGTVVTEPAERPNASWTEKEIKAWILSTGLSIDYNINSKTKKCALAEIDKAL